MKELGQISHINILVDLTNAISCLIIITLTKGN